MRAQPELALGLLRVGVGALFAWHGFGKIFTVGLQAVTAEFSRAGVPLPPLTAPLSATLELVGGVVLLLGLGTRGLALLLAGMTAALLALGWGSPLRSGGWEAPALLLLGTATIALGGGGRPTFGGQRPSGPPAVLAPSRARKRSD